ncbi:CPA1 family monovalent cation:H+ antiporter [Microbacterium resistens]|uniref:CPA1 family monovalent cation:H+ antiporter n=1 Tax=Microbacterium resistens TaxID=156977 RepID=A0ABU1S7W4_9MICO|nr:Na+/H+ antiporter [Microbacterium resistens]MDR6865696.1 CPA1 family monovalent cation:H+ antiporter [Microbacterium resistens]
MEGLEVTVLLGLTILAGTMLAPRLRVALPLVLVVFGLLLGFVPALREVQLPPETVLLLFLPVMLYWESITTSLRSIRRDFRYILPMSTLLVVASAFAVAAVGTLFGVPWEIALILGAAVAPPDATAVAALGRLLPRRGFMKLKAESLTNDGTALVLYAIAVSLAMGGNISPLSVTMTVVVSYLGGIAAGAVVAALAWALLRRMTTTIAINVAMLLVPFTAFLLAELIHASGVLAVVVAGLIVAFLGPRISTAASRRQAEAVWPFGVFLLNGALFVLIGLEVQWVVHQTSFEMIGRLVLVTLAVWATLLVVRFLFQLLSAPFQRIAGTPQHPRGLRTRARVVSTVAGMRGAVSLAIALSVPLTMPDGSPLAGRDEIVFVTAGVILLSLLVQAPALPAIVRWAGFPVDHAEDEEYELAERAISGAAMAALDDLATEHAISAEVRDRVRREGYERLELANARAMARERALIDAEVGAMEAMLDTPDPLAATTGDARADTDADADLVDGVGGPSVLSDLPDGTTLQMIATSEDVDLLQRSPLLRHEELARLKLAMLEHKRGVLHGLRRAGTVDDLVVRRISARLDLEQVRLQGIEDVD